VRDVQTDLIQVLDKWTQHPADHTGACGGKTCRTERQAVRGTGKTERCLLSFSPIMTDPGRSQDAMGWNPAQINIDSQRLAMFLHSAAQVTHTWTGNTHLHRQHIPGQVTHTWTGDLELEDR